MNKECEKRRSESSLATFRFLLVRQKPGSPKRVMFITIENATGIASPVSGRRSMEGSAASSSPRA